MANPEIVEVTRGSWVESRHRGAIVVVDAEGSRLVEIGDVERPVFPRSSVKLIQALPLVESGAADAFGFGDAELALACASHSGDPRHVAIVSSMLEKCGRGPDDLECGAHMPIDRMAGHALLRSGDTASQLHNNCPGKHAAFICLAAYRGIDPKAYVGSEHPVQRDIRTVLEETIGTSLGSDVCAIDGCSIPAYAMPLDRIALAYARLVSGKGIAQPRASAARRLFDACMNEPSLVAGAGRFDTDVMAAFSGRLFVKTGAEGGYCGAIPERGLGIAVKCDDGATRAAEVMVAAAIDALLPTSETERDVLSARLRPPIVSRKREKIGEIRPTAGLIESIRNGAA